MYIYLFVCIVFFFGIFFGIYICISQLRSLWFLTPPPIQTPFLVFIPPLQQQPKKKNGVVVDILRLHHQEKQVKHFLAAGQEVGIWHRQAPIFSTKLLGCWPLLHDKCVFLFTLIFHVLTSQITIVRHHSGDFSNHLEQFYVVGLVRETVCCSKNGQQNVVWVRLWFILVFLVWKDRQQAVLVNFLQGL